MPSPASALQLADDLGVAATGDGEVTGNNVATGDAAITSYWGPTGDGGATRDGGLGPPR